MLTKEIIEGTLFVYWRGRLIYKRWLWRSCGVVIDNYGINFAGSQRLEPDKPKETS